MQAITIIEGQTFDSWPIFVKDDYGWNINFVIKYNDDSVVDLTGATVKFKMAPFQGGTLKIDGTCTLDTPTSGTCHYTLLSTDFDTIGNFDTEVEVTLPTGPQVFTVKKGKLQIVADL